MHKQSLPDALKSVLREFAEKQRKARDLSNAANRAKTTARNSIKTFWQEHQLPIGSFIRTDGFEFKYEANVTEEIDADEVLRMYDDEEITRDQMLRMLKIDKQQAKNVLGGDVVAELTEEVVGKEIDVRIATLPVENDDDEFVAVNRAVKKRVKRRKFGGSEERQSVKDAGRRRVRTRSSK